jgi:hypothetical protein
VASPNAAFASEPACIICAAIGGGLATLCAQVCAHYVFDESGSDKGEILQ